ncbi:hypothetical protein [Nonomuraea turcica]|nr:hypothetical protein [Nonomuraea sp. G32]MDP4503725.1 hypothetical protein [Nonomuraea sp. G32]
MKTPKFPPRGLSSSRILLAAVIAWIVLLTVLILLDPRSAGATP